MCAYFKYHNETECGELLFQTSFKHIIPQYTVRNFCVYIIMPVRASGPYWLAIPTILLMDSPIQCIIFTYVNIDTIFICLYTVEVNAAINFLPSRHHFFIKIMIFLLHKIIKTYNFPYLFRVIPIKSIFIGNISTTVSQCINTFPFLKYCQFLDTSQLRSNYFKIFFKNQLILKDQFRTAFTSGEGNIIPFKLGLYDPYFFSKDTF